LTANISSWESISCQAFSKLAATELSELANTEISLTFDFSDNVTPLSPLAKRLTDSIKSAIFLLIERNTAKNTRKEMAANNTDSAID